MSKKTLHEQVKADPQLAAELLQQLLTDKALLQETLDQNLSLRQEILAHLLERYCLSQADFAEATGADNARITRDVNAGILAPVYVFGNKKYYYTRIFLKDDQEKYRQYVAATSLKNAQKVKEELKEKAGKREIKRKIDKNNKKV